MRYAIIILILVFLAGCGQEKPINSYNELLEKAGDVQEIKIIYDMKVGLLGNMEGMHMGIMKKGDREKSATEANIMGNKFLTYAFKIDNTSIYCEKHDVPAKDSYCQRKKQPGSLYKPLDPKGGINITEEVTINYSGRRKIMGRESRCFKLHAHNFSAFHASDNVLFRELIDTGNKIDVFACLDEETGYPLVLNYSKRTRSEVTGMVDKQSLFRFKAIKFERSVKESELQVPVPFAINDSGIYNEHIYLFIDVFEDAHKVKIHELPASYDNDNNIHSRTLDLELDAVSQRMIKVKKKEAYTGSVLKLCMNGHCSNTTLYRNRCMSLQKEKCEKQMIAFLMSTVKS